MAAYAQAELFEPLGMGELLIARDPQGDWFGGSSLWMTPRDMLRFGQLYLNEGSWQGEQIVPRSWVHESTRNQIGELSAPDLNLLNARYGYQWWIFEDAYAAIGSGGQMILIIPSLDFVAVITRAGPEIDLFGDYILAALKSAWFPARANPEAQTAVVQLVNKLAAPRPTKAVARPSLASDLSGLRFEVIATDSIESPLGLTAFTLRFDDASGAANVLFETTESIELVALGDRAAPALSKSGLAIQRPDGKSDIAAAGWWLSDKQFAMDIHEVGYPAKARWLMTFNNKSATVSINIRGAYKHTYIFSAQASSSS